jgi:hypothetical protein
MPKAKSGNWTRKVISRLARVGKQLKYSTCGHDCDDAERMCDLLWLDYDRNKKLRGAVLALECEWGKAHHIAYEFSKLLLTRADLRVLIFDGDNVKNAQEIINELRDEVGRFQQSAAGDKYLFAYWKKQGKDDRRGKFEFESFMLRPAKRRRPTKERGQKDAMAPQSPPSDDQITEVFEGKNQKGIDSLSPQAQDVSPTQ